MIYYYYKSNPDLPMRIWLALVLFASCRVVSAQQPGEIFFERRFAPQEGLVKPAQKPYRDEICLNGSWEFQPVPLPADYDLENGTPLLPLPSKDGWSSVPIRIPSPWNVNAFSYSGGKTFPSYPDAWNTARMGWLRKIFRVPAAWKDKRIVVHFEAVCGYAQVFLNGKQVAEHFDNSTPFEADITDFVDRENENELLVGVRQVTLFDVPGMFGQHTYPSGSPWTRQMIGIWQDVFLQALPPVRIQDMAVRSLLDQHLLEMEITLVNNTGIEQSYELGGEILPWLSKADLSDRLLGPEPNWSLGQAVDSFSSLKGKIGPRTFKTVVLKKQITNELDPWSPESPRLYALLMDVKLGSQVVDKYYQRFGWRQWAIRGRDVILNGKPYQLLGESGHLLGVPYLTPRYAWSWYKAIKDLHGNAIRLHANLRPRFYLDLADEMGIAILDESEIYASTMEINYFDPDTWLRFKEHLRAMVTRDRNHASVFGWSIANEILSALWWKGTPRKFWPPVLDNMVMLADYVKELDPTRDWISSDGDGDFHGRIPVYIYHYGKPQDWNRQAPPNKPFGIGEGGSMLWGSPAVFSVYNGERSYESRQGMYEGIAIESYWYLAEQRKISAFTSLFTLAGYCFQTMRLGKPRIPDAGDRGGIRFGPLVEGQPGMQPERMPYYANTFNPGYDPAQPLYIKTPVFDAVQAAYHPGGPIASPYDHRVSSPPLPARPKPVTKSVHFIGDDSSALYQALVTAGIGINKKSKKILVIDGASFNKKESAESLNNQIRNTLAARGTVFLWLDPGGRGNSGVSFGETIRLKKHPAAALYADRVATETAAIPLADLYFGSESDPDIVDHVLEGSLVNRSKTLIGTNVFAGRWFEDSDSTRWPVTIALDSLGGRFLVTSLKADVRSAKRLKLLRSLFANLGVDLGRPVDTYDRGFDGAGFLSQALVLGSFQGENYPAILDHTFIEKESMAGPRPGDNIGNRNWTLVRSLSDGLFDFFRLGIPGTEGSRARAQGPELKPEALDANNYLEVIERVSGTNPGTNSVCYLSFWVASPRDIPADKLKMILRSDDGIKLWVNGENVFEDHRIYGPGLTEPKVIPVSFSAGWNRVLVKIGQLDGLWNFSLKFSSPEQEIIEALRARASRPGR